MHDGKSKAGEIQKQKSGSSVLQGKEPPSRLQLQQQPSDPMQADYDLDLGHDFDIAFTDDQHLGGNPDLLLSPNLSSFLDSMLVDYDVDHGFDTTLTDHLNTRVHTISKDDTNAPFAQVRTPYGLCFRSITN